MTFLKKDVYFESNYPLIQPSVNLILADNNILIFFKNWIQATEQVVDSSGTSWINDLKNIMRLWQQKMGNMEAAMTELRANVEKNKRQIKKNQEDLTKGNCGVVNHF